jgi:hypothetical protein
VSGHEYYELGRLTVAVSVLGGLFLAFWLADKLLDEIVNVRFFRLDRDEPAWIMADWKREWHQRRRELGDRVGKVALGLGTAAFWGLIVYLIVAAVV